MFRRWHPSEGRILLKGVTRMRSFGSSLSSTVGYSWPGMPHISCVPPTGAKGMNLALAGVYHLSVALDRFYRRSDEVKRAVSMTSPARKRIIHGSQRLVPWAGDNVDWEFRFPDPATGKIRSEYFPARLFPQKS